MAKQKILIVDDELMLLLSMQRMLEDSYDITIAIGAQQAIDILKLHNDFDLIICDIYMPEMNGINFYLFIEKEYPALAKRMIFMTGGSLNDDINELFAAKENVCLSKPFEAENLKQAINDFLQPSA